MVTDWCGIVEARARLKTYVRHTALKDLSM